MKENKIKNIIKKINILDKRKWIIGAIFLIVVLFLVNFYTGFPTRKISEPVFRLIPIPVAVVDKTKIIFSNELIEDNLAVKKFYQSQDFSASGLRIDFETEEGKMRLKIKEREILDKLIEDAIVKKIADEKNINITQTEAEKELGNKIAQAKVESQEFALNVRKLYGWRIKDFSQKIVYPQLYMKKLVEDYEKKTAENSKAYKKIKEAEERLAQDNSNFEEIARQYSEGSSASSGGELGWFKQDQLVPEVAEKAFQLEPGNRSEIIASTLGFHLILAEKKRKIQENGAEIEEVRLKQIFTREEGFLQWLVNKKRNFNVLILVRDYAWDSNEAQVIFRNQLMAEREDDLRLKSMGDPSMQPSVNN